MEKITRQKFVCPLLIFIITLCLYVFFAGRFRFEFPVHPSNYYSHLSYSLLNGRLDLINPSWTHDLTIWDEKIYMYWGPTPILLILPFTKFFGLNFSDALYTAILSSLSPLVFYLILNELDKLSIAQISNFKKLILTLFFGFGTVYFVLSVNGGIWSTSQAISTLYILISLLFILKFKRINKVFFLILSAIFLNLGIWGRTGFIFYLPLFLVIIFSARNFKKRLLIFFLICLLFFSMFITYNYLRFGSFLENGFSASNKAGYFAEKQQMYGVFNINYVSFNSYYMFLNLPRIKSNFPYLEFDFQGNSIFSTSPLFLLLFLVVKKRYWKGNLILFNGSLILSVTVVIFYLLLFYATGYFQFGYRYLMDAIPLMLIVLAQVAEKVRIEIILILCVLSIAVNTAGVLWFLDIF